MTESSADSSPEESAHHGLVLLGRPWWQGVGAIVGLLALVLAWITYQAGQDGDDEPRPPPTVVPAGGVTGDCNAIGSGNQVTCVTPNGTASLGKIDIRWPRPYGFVFVGKPKDLPVPPPYPRRLRSDGHCEHWQDWAYQQPGFYQDDVETFANLTAGTPDLVAIRRLQVIVYKKQPVLPADQVHIGCIYGAGGEAGYSIDAWAGRTYVEVTDLNTDKTFMMPPGSLSLAGPEVTTVQITVRSEPDLLYEGSIVIDAEINGVAEKIAIGSADQPIRWINTREKDSETFYDWSLYKNRWLKNPKPYEIYPEDFDPKESFE